MDRIGRAVGDHLRRARSAERFVKLIVGGGIALVGGLWVVHLARAWSLPWLAGVVLAALGMAGLAVGIGSEIDY